MKQLNFKHIIGATRPTNTTLIVVYDETVVGGSKRFDFATRAETDRVFHKIQEEIKASRS